MEKNTNAKISPENSPDGGDRTPVGSSPPARNVIELPSSSDTPPVAPETGAADIGGRQTVEVDAPETVEVGTSYEYLGGGSEADQGKKRGRGDVNPGGEQMKAAKKKGELSDVPKGEPRCATCNKVFKSWKALFGHLRSHPERSYRGALPPPTAAELDIHRCQQQLASTLLTVAQVVASRRGLDIDLNQQPSTAEEGSTSHTKGSGVGFDLNVEPPPESDEEE